MHRAEVGTTRPDDDALDYTPTSFLSASAACLPISMMVVLEATFFSSDVSVIRHRVSAQINAFSQSLFHCLKHRLKILPRDSVWAREGMNSGAPENFIGVDIADTGNQTLVR